jgi:hypothetical protein
MKNQLLFQYKSLRRKNSKFLWARILLLPEDVVLLAEDILVRPEFVFVPPEFATWVLLESGLPSMVLGLEN